MDVSPLSPNCWGPGLGIFMGPPRPGGPRGPGAIPESQSGRSPKSPPRGPGPTQRKHQDKKWYLVYYPLLKPTLEMHNYYRYYLHSYPDFDYITLPSLHYNCTCLSKVWSGSHRKSSWPLHGRWHRPARSSHVPARCHGWSSWKLGWSTHVLQVTPFTAHAHTKLTFIS